MTWFIRRQKKRRPVLVLGLDCADPHLVFEQYKTQLPVLNGLAAQGTYGWLESCIPCITVPAWASMLSGRDPGVLGIYGFRNRVDYSYNHLEVADSRCVRTKRVWDYAGAAGLDSVVIGVPQTYPVKPMQGHLVSCFLTPDTNSLFTYPAIFKQEVLKVAPDYVFDVRDFRTHDKQRLLQHIIDMTEAQFRLIKHCLITKSWDLFLHVSMGIDRIHHAFWRFCDPQHRLYEPGNAFSSVICDYYRMLDSMIGEILSLIDDDVCVLVVSDHGVKRMDGAICINEWLWRQGWLALKNPPLSGMITPFDQVEVDWTKTRAWASGGYYSRVFLNVAGREPQGIIQAGDYETIRSGLAEELAAVPIPDDSARLTTVYRPETIYTEVHNYPPDLLVYFGDLHWRAAGSLGHGAYFTLENDTGPDDANHAQHGLFILYEPGCRGAGRIEGRQLMDIAPTILHLMGLAVPPALQGSIIRD